MKKKNLKLINRLSTLGLTLLLSSLILSSNDKTEVAHGGWQPGPPLFGVNQIEEVAHGGWQPGPPLFGVNQTEEVAHGGWQPGPPLFSINEESLV